MKYILSKIWKILSEPFTDNSIIDGGLIKNCHILNINGEVYNLNGITCLYCKSKLTLTKQKTGLLAICSYGKATITKDPSK